MAETDHHDEKSIQLAATFDILTPAEIDGTETILDSYRSFWSHVRFKKGWATPFFTPGETIPLLRKAAEIVFRIRNVFDSTQKDKGIKIRLVEGKAKEYLWALTEEKRKPGDFPEEFIKQVVLETLKIDDGYEYGLKKENIESFISLIISYMESPKSIWSDLEDTRSSDEVFGLVKKHKFFSARIFGLVKLVEYAGIDCSGATVLACYSTIGLLSAIVGNQLVKAHKLPLIGHIQSPVFPVSCTVQGEQPMWPVRFYGNKNLVVFIGGFEIPPSAVFSLVEATVDFAVRRNCPMIYSIEGIPNNEENVEGDDEDESIIIDDTLITKMSLREESKNPEAQKEEEKPVKAAKRKALGTDSPKKTEEESILELAEKKYGKLMHYVTTDVGLAKTLHSKGLIPCVDAILPSFTGVLLAGAPLSPIDTTVLLAPNSTQYPDYQAAIPPLKLLNSLLPQQAEITASISTLYRDSAKLQRAIKESATAEGNLRASGQIGMYG